MTKKKYWATYRDAAIAMVPKCGHTSFDAMVGARLSIDEALRIPMRVQFVRDPIDRFVSAYSFFYALNEDNPHRESVPKNVTHNGYESFVDYALSNPNPHWMPQTELTGGIATRLHKFTGENIRRWWSHYWPGKLPDWFNACTHLPTTDYRIADLREYYATDIVAFERAE